ncbi:retrovirus-related Pol polyprotein from transposon 17.6 [Trichonephila clavipes]|nr:retrovirus-related Pol polyprotein from transposon 17.6 [Trichonephila clavipes]
MGSTTDLINQIGHANVITCLDVLKGHWKIPSEEQKKSQDLASFKTHRSHYRWKVMPFGLRNETVSFQKVMNTALSKHREFCRVYLDDILDAAWPKLTELKSIVNVKKFVLEITQIKYCGHLIGVGRHQPNSEKFRAIEMPKTKTALKSAFGLFNYNCDDVKKYAELSKTLTDSTKKKVPGLIPLD